MRFAASLVLLGLSASAAADDDVYDPVGKRDPFARPPVRPPCNPGGERHGMQRWAVDSFTVVGVIRSPGADAATLVDPEGVGWTVRVGSYVGADWGRVSAISQQGVTVQEEYVDVDGNLLVVTTDLHFP